jgi:hypothetical protein
MVPGDTPKWGLDLINRFTAGKPFWPGSYHYVAGTRELLPY